MFLNVKDNLIARLICKVRTKLINKILLYFALVHLVTITKKCKDHYKLHQ